MSDGTTILKCKLCGREFDPINAQQEYCNYHCQRKHYMLLRQVNEYKDALEIEREIRSREWKRSYLGQLVKFYEIFGKDYNCDICNKSFVDNVKEYGVPLHVFLNSDIRDHRVMNPDNWMKLCTKCFSNVQYLKLQEQINDGS